MILEKQFSSIQFLFSYAFLNGNQLLKKELPFLEVDPNFSRCVCVCVCVCVLLYVHGKQLLSCRDALLT